MHAAQGLWSMTAPVHPPAPTADTRLSRQPDATTSPNPQNLAPRAVWPPGLWALTKIVIRAPQSYQPARIAPMKRSRLQSL